MTESIWYADDTCLADRWMLIQYPFDFDGRYQASFCLSGYFSKPQGVV